MYWLRYSLGLGLDCYPLLLAVATWPRLRSRLWLPRLNMAALAAGLVLLLSFGWEWYAALSANQATSDVNSEQYALLNRAFGPYAWAYWLGLLPLLLSQGFWWQRARRNIVFSVLFALTWFLLPVAERLVAILASRHHDYLPSSWAMFSPESVVRVPLLLTGLGVLLWLRRRARSGATE